jgi:TetR/AcrR family transcriptional repressor of lmrAB and yxaGH operons
MAMPAQHRQAIVRAAVALFRKQGFAATGLAEILARSGAPKGSLYHYFPGGKGELGEAAVRQAGATVTRTLTQLRDEAPSAAELIRRYVDLLAIWMKKSSWRDGCPITTTLLETAHDLPTVAAAGRSAFADWAAVLGGALEREGADPARARRLARFAISALEGALVQAKVERNEAALAEAGEELARLMAETVGVSVAARHGS